MTNDNIRTKANAVFFAAIMVVSMVAVGFAAAPAAAAADSVDATEADLNGDGTTNITVTSDVNTDDEAVVIIDTNENGTYDQGEDILLEGPDDVSEVNGNNELSFNNVDVSSEDVGTYDVYAEAGSTNTSDVPSEPADGASLGTNNDFGQATTTFDVIGSEAADFVVSNLDAPGTVEEGNSFTVSADITNDGGSDGTTPASQDIEYRAGDDVSGSSAADVTDTNSSLALQPGETKNVEFTVPGSDTSTLGPGTVTHGIFTDDDSQTASLTVTVSNPTATENREVVNDDVYVLDGNSVFQGEEDIVFYNSTTDEEFQASDLEGTSGNREGTPLQMPIPEDEETGTYDANGVEDGSGGLSTTVVEPRITTAEVQLDGDDINQIASSRATPDDLSINATFNFQEAEDIIVTVEDPSGADITSQVVNSSQDGVDEEDNDIILRGDDNGDASAGLDLEGEDAGEYTVIFEGSDDLDYDEVIEEYTIETTNQDDVTVEVAEDPVTQGDNLDYTISGAINNDHYLAVIEPSDFRDGFTDEDAEDVFRNVGETQEVGFEDDADGDVDYAYAIVQVDGTTATGAIETRVLDDSSVDLDIYDTTEGVSDVDIDDDDIDSVDDTDFEVEEGEITIDSPTGTYTVGSEVDINGSASSADEVVIFARDNDDYEPVNIDGGDNDVLDGSGASAEVDDEYIITVDSDDTFEEEDVTLSEANDIFSFEGSYDIGVVDAADLDTSSEDGNFDDGQLSTSDFSQASSDRATLQVRSGDLTGNFSTVNGQIAQVDDNIDVEGTAAGQDNVVVAFVDERGNTVAQEVSVDSDDTFEEDDIPLDDLTQGAVSAHIISESRDGTIGDGDDLPQLDDDATGSPGATTTGLVTYIEDLGTETSGSGDQVRSRIVSNTVEADGSDDLIINANFRLNDATLSIRDVYPEEAQAEGVNPVAVGETAVIAGDTNRNSEDAAISIEVLDENENSVASTSTDEWGNDGQFSASLDTSDLETGTYIVEADDGESTDRVNIELVDEREEPADGEDGADDGEDGTDEDGADEDGADDGADDEDGADDGADNGTDGDDGGDTEDSTPGFGALVALVALIAAALLATRRND